MHNLFGFDQEYAYTVEHFVQPGDQAVIYLAKLSAIWGVVEITRVLLNQQDEIGWLKKGWEARKNRNVVGRFPARVQFRSVCELRPPRTINGADNPFRNELEYITDKQRWNVFVQIALSRIPESDVQTVLRWATAPR